MILQISNGSTKIVDDTFEDHLTGFEGSHLTSLNFSPVLGSLCFRTVLERGTDDAGHRTIALESVRCRVSVLVQLLSGGGAFCSFARNNTSGLVRVDEYVGEPVLS